MKRTIIPVIMLAAIMQLNGAAGRTSALWSAARTGGLFRPAEQQVFTAGRTTLPQVGCPVGSRLISTGGPSTATRLSGRFGALAKTPTPQAEQGSYWSRFKRLLVPTGTAAVAAGAYMAAQEEEQEEPGAWLQRLPTTSEELEVAKAYFGGRRWVLSEDKAQRKIETISNGLKSAILAAEEGKELGPDLEAELSLFSQRLEATKYNLQHAIDSINTTYPNAGPEREAAIENAWKKIARDWNRDNKDKILEKYSPRLSYDIEHFLDYINSQKYPERGNVLMTYLEAMNNHLDLFNAEQNARKQAVDERVNELRRLEQLYGDLERKVQLIAKGFKPTEMLQSFSTYPGFESEFITPSVKRIQEDILVDIRDLKELPESEREDRAMNDLKRLLKHPEFIKASSGDSSSLRFLPGYQTAESRVQE